RSQPQLDLSDEAKAGALHFVALMRSLWEASLLSPFADLNSAAAWAATILARFLLLPTDDELVMCGEIKHDVNLGTQSLAVMIAPSAADRLITAKVLPKVFTTPGPPMWLAGTLASVSPVHGFLYALLGAGHLPGDVFGDAKCGEIEIALTS